MCPFHGAFLKWSILIWFTICIMCISAKTDSTDTNFNAFNFDEIKFDLFLNFSDYKNSNRVNKFNDRISTEGCLTELKAIKYGLVDSDGWATKSVLVLYLINIWLC